MKFLYCFSNDGMYLQAGTSGDAWYQTGHPAACVCGTWPIVRRSWQDPLFVRAFILFAWTFRYLRRIRQNYEEEVRLMKNVPDWEVGKWYHQPIFKTVPENHWIGKGTSVHSVVPVCFCNQELIRQHLFNWTAPHSFETAAAKFLFCDLQQETGFCGKYDSKSEVMIRQNRNVPV